MVAVRLSLRGKEFLVRPETFARYPDSLLGAMFRPGLGMKPGADDEVPGVHFIDRDPDLFRRVILSVYDHGTWHWSDGDDPRIVYTELCYYGLAPVDIAPECRVTRAAAALVAMRSCADWVVDFVRPSYTPSDADSMLGNVVFHDQRAVRCWMLRTGYLLDVYVRRSGTRNSSVDNRMIGWSDQHVEPGSYRVVYTPAVAVDQAMRNKRVYGFVFDTVRL